MDINCDMGEIPAMILDGSQEALMPYLTSANIACGGHAGDKETMNATLRQALRWNLRIGAHPGYPDRANFGRVAIEMEPEAIAEFVFEQVRELARLAANHGAAIRHVKPHGALYNSAAVNSTISKAIAQGVARWSRELVLMGLAGSIMLDVFRDAGFRVEAEAFADRRYEPDGTLRSRAYPDALILDPAAAAAQALDLAGRGAAQTICIHGDTPGALEIAKAVSAALDYN